MALTYEEVNREYENRYIEKRKETMENKSKLDVHFIELYIKKMYREDLSQYYLVTPGVTSRWRNNYGAFPDSRIHEFTFREGSNDIVELLKRIYE
jgi:hypothetical protein